MYRVIESGGDTVAVPRLVFAQLARQGANDARFRVALYLVEHGEAAAEKVAKELHIPREKVAGALEFWEGKGLLEYVCEASEVGLQPTGRRRLKTHEVTAAAECDAALKYMVQELQSILGGVVSQQDINIFVTLCQVDGFAPEVVLMAASYCASMQRGSARYVEKELSRWRREEGVVDAASMDRFLQQQTLRAEREGQVAQLLGQPAESFTLTERKHIARWFEEYGFELAMVKTARMFAGEKENEIKYLSGILKKWYGKGLMTPKDVQQQSDGRNLRVTAERREIAPEEDVMMNNAVYTRGGKKR